MFKTCALVNISKQSLLKRFQTPLKYLLSNMIQETSETEVKCVKDSFCQNDFLGCIFTVLEFLIFFSDLTVQSLMSSFLRKRYVYCLNTVCLWPLPLHLFGVNLLLSGRVIDEDLSQTLAK